jgi:integrase
VVRLTDISVKNMKPAGVRLELVDDHLSGLYLLVHPSGRKSWCVRYRHHGISRKLTIGRYPLYSLKQARAEAAKALRAVAEGRDPSRERQEARSDAFASIAASFLERHSRRHNRENTYKANEALLRLHVIPKWQRLSIQDIKKRDVVNLLEGIAARHPIAANRAHSCLSKLFGWAVHTDIIEHNPLRDVQRPSKEQSRDRVLNDNEIAKVWRGTGTLNDAFGAAVRVLLLTGQRRDEVLLMPWSEVDLEKRLWSLPAARVKNNRAHDVPLSDAVMAILQARPRNGEHVFADERGKTPSKARGKERLDRVVGTIEPWRLHDLRRTVASGMARLGVNLPVIEKCLNHQSGSFAGIAGVYQRHSFAAEKQKALQQWADHVAVLTKG